MLRYILCCRRINSLQEIVRRYFHVLFCLSFVLCFRQLEESILRNGICRYNRPCDEYTIADKRIFRIPLRTDPRIFTKVARNSKKWKRLYKKRTSIERVNGRIDRDFQFEKHTIRGLEKMKMFLTVTFIIQLASAKAKIESGTKSGLAKHCA